MKKELIKHLRELYVVVELHNSLSDNLSVEMKFLIAHIKLKFLLLEIEDFSSEKRMIQLLQAGADFMNQLKNEY